MTIVIYYFLVLLLTLVVLFGSIIMSYIFILLFMTALKTKISVTVSSHLAQLLEESAKFYETSKSAIVEQALQDLIEEKLAKDAKKLAKLKFDDLPSEDEWVLLQSEI